MTPEENQDRDRVLELLARREDVFMRLKKLLIESLHVSRPEELIDPDVSLFGTGLCLDSVDAVELLVCLEAEFGLTIPDQNEGRAIMRTVNTVIDAVIEHGAY